MGIFHITALQESPQKFSDRSVPKVIQLNTANVVKAISTVDDVTGYERTNIKYRKGRYVKTIRAAEKYGQYLLQTDWENSASSPYNIGTKANVAGGGSALADTPTALTAYHNSVTAVALTADDGVALPAASSTRTGTVVVVFNKSGSAPVKVYPASTNILDSTSANVVSVPVGQFRHFYASATNKWVTCKGPYNS